MQLPVFENAYFLQSAGWAITNSFWQAGMLWLLYQLITTLDKSLSSLVKYHLSITLTAASFIWFLFTIVENFRVLRSNMVSGGEDVTGNWLFKFEYINTVLPYLSFIYLIILCLYSVQFAKRIFSNRILQKSGLTKAPLDFRLFVNHTAIHLGIKKKIGVWISAHVDVPSVTGFIKPVILLPVAIINHLSAKQVEAILLHELAHVKRNDYIVNVAQSFIELILFFNPFVFLLSNIARKERENCCDDWVLNYRYNQQDYARALLLLEEQRQSKPGFALAATNNKKTLLNRIKRLFQPVAETNFTKWQQLKFISVCILILIAISFGLPYVIKKPFKLANLQQPALVNIQTPHETSSNSEHFRENTLRSQPITTIIEKKTRVKITSQKIRNKKETENHYVNAYINEELLTPSDAQKDIPILTSEKDIADVRYYVKIEEQQSGKKQTNTYVFELKNENGLPSVKPLIILNKLKVSLKGSPIRLLTDTIIKPIRKRVTS
ncbi:MAG: M56 family metallopeptidase [Ferruginibacter sp.]